MPASSFQQQKLRVCEVCSAYLGLHDNDRRLADHFGGKLHLGFIQIREKLDQLKVHVSYLSVCVKPFGYDKSENMRKKISGCFFLLMYEFLFIFIRKLWLISKRKGTKSA